MKVAIIGSRNIHEFDYDTIIRNLPESTDTIVSGGAQGADRIAEDFAKSKGFAFMKIKPDYDTYGKNATLARNKKIIEAADIVLAIWDYKSRGTAHTIAQCIREGVPVKILSVEESCG